MYKLSMDLNPSAILKDLRFVREQVVDDETFQTCDAGLVLSYLDDIIAMCDYAISHGYEK